MVESMEKRTTSKMFTGDFWLDIIIKQGIPAGIALFLVWNMSVRQEAAIQRLNDNITALSIKIEGLRK